MTDIDTYLAAVKERAEKACNMRSDDFGHSTQDLLEWESRELDAFVATHVPTLLAIIADCREELRKAEAVLNTVFSDDALWTSHGCPRIGGWDAIAEKWKGRGDGKAQ